LGQSVLVSILWIAADSDTPLKRLDRILVAESVDAVQH
jgi:hypothetical protein